MPLALARRSLVACHLLNPPAAGAAARVVHQGCRNILMQHLTLKPILSDSEGANVTVQISALRRALDEGRTGPSPIQTLPGRGYRFVAPVTRYVEEPRSGSGADENRGADELTSAPVTSAPIAPIAALPRRRRAALAIAAAFLAMLVFAAGAWRLWLIERTSSARQVAAVASITPFIAPRLSIVMLPFVNLSADPDQH